MPLSQEQILAALRSVVDPELHKDVVLLNRVKGVGIDGLYVKVRLDAAGAAAQSVASIERQTKDAIKRIGAERVEVEFIGGAPQPQAAKATPLPQVKHIVAVGAGKGGVGKSTMALNLAVALRRTGAHVGLMDGDIYGPSMPTMLGIKGLSPQLVQNKILPFAVHGIHAVTIGALVEQDKPLIWRGPMAHGAFKQLLLDNTQWPDLDYLIVDLPPGTGDVPLTLCQLLPLTGAVIVATPQQVALDDAVRAIKMFEQLQAPVLGLIENMSYMPLPDGTEVDLFGRGGTERKALELNLPFLGAVPMFRQLRENSDAGTPGRNFDGDPRLRDALDLLAKNLLAEIAQRGTGPAPTLTIS